MYTSGDGEEMAAEVLGVHTDDIERGPYYTILLPGGRERQTDGYRLSLMG
jgi:hypothetical protein